MKKILKYGAITMCLVITFFMFEPIFVWPFGWHLLPDKTLKKNNSTVKAPEFLQAITESQKVLFHAHDLSQAPAISIAVGLEDEIIWSEARGYADVENEIAADTKTRFRIGSVSKAVTSVAMGKLLEQGKLKLDNPVGQYLPDFKKSEITLRQLASHTSGIRNYGICLCFPVSEYYNQKTYHSIEESLQVFSDDALLFKPGTSFSYSTYNYTVLSAVTEEVSGEKFLEFMDYEVFHPLGMHDTSADYADKKNQNKAIFYEVVDGAYKKAFPVDNSNKWAGGGLVSTPTDLVKMGNALLGYSILKKQTIATLFEVQNLADGNIDPQHYALGWRRDAFTLLEGKKQVQVVHHGGTAVGATALLILIPEYNLSIAIMMNKSSESFQMFDYVLPIAEQFILQLADKPFQQLHTSTQKD